MRLKKYLTEAGKFDYQSQVDAENHRTLKGIIKNNGIFKSTKQRWFLLEKKWRYWKVGGKGDHLFKNGADVKKMRGISGVQDGDYVVEVNAAMMFGKRGAGQGYRRLEWGYVVDDVGVREEYKYGFKYFEGGSASEIDKSKKKLLWKRQETDAAKDFAAEVAQEKMNRESKVKAGAAQLKGSEYIGVIGERVKDVEVEVLRKHWFETQWGSSAITVMKDSEGNMIHHFGNNALEKGDKKKVAFTVNGHEKAEVNKWNKIAYKYTDVKRVK